MSCLRAVENELKTEKDVGLTADIIRALTKMDERYREFCNRFDEEDGKDLGTTYEDDFGPSVEFYVEADHWHELSLALRQWKAENPDWDD